MYFVDSFAAIEYLDQNWFQKRSEQLFLQLEIVANNEEVIVLWGIGTYIFLSIHGSFCISDCNWLLIICYWGGCYCLLRIFSLKRQVVSSRPLLINDWLLIVLVGGSFLWSSWSHNFCSVSIFFLLDDCRTFEKAAW